MSKSEPDCDLCGDTGYITVIEPLRYGEGREAQMLCPNGCAAPPTRGLYDKFRVTRTDNRDKPGERHHGDRYFVLDLTHDPLAGDAVRAYAAQLPADSPLRLDLNEIIARFAHGGTIREDEAYRVGEGGCHG